MVDLVRDLDAVGIFDFYEVAEVYELEILHLLHVATYFHNHIFGPEVAIHCTCICNILQKSTNRQNQVGQLNLAVTLRKNVVERMMVQVVVLDHFLGIKLDVPEQLL